MALIELREVTKTYGRPGEAQPALVDIHLDIEEGEFVLLRGPSGAGKSTLLKLILAMERPDHGTISVSGRDVHRLTRGSVPFLRRNLGAVFQDFQLLPAASPLDNVGLALEVLSLSPSEVRERAKAALEGVGIDPESRTSVAKLSGGEQQRVALARALVVDPPILLADEPTGNLDPKLASEVFCRLEEVCAMGRTVILASHDPLLQSRVEVDRILDLEAGRLIDDIKLGAPPSHRPTLPQLATAGPVSEARSPLA